MADPDEILKPKVPEPIDRNLVEAGWRYQLIAPLLSDADEARKRAYRKELLEEPVLDAWRNERKLTPRTLRRWCQRYKTAGLEGLVFQRRKDRGRLRAFPTVVLERALKLREEDPRRSVPQLVEHLVGENPAWESILRRSTLDRHLRALGSVRQPREKGPQGPFSPWEAEGPNQLWQADVLHGPVALFGEKPRRCRVIAWLDDFSRFVCVLLAYPDERLPSLEDALKKAILRYGAPTRIFVDNAWIFRGTTFTLACSTLGIQKIHSTPRYPASRGKVERFFRTLRAQLLNEVENLEPLPSEDLNRYLAAWVDRYNHRKHSSTKQTPLERFSGRPLRTVSLEQLEEAFLQWGVRKISSTGEIKFGGNLYRVDPSFAGQKIVIRYDPYELSRIFLWKEGKKVATATPKRLVRRQLPGRVSKKAKNNSEAALRYLEGLTTAHDDRLARETNLTNFPEKEQNS